MHRHKLYALKSRIDHGVDANWLILAINHHKLIKDSQWIIWLTPSVTEARKRWPIRQCVEFLKHHYTVKLYESCCMTNLPGNATVHSLHSKATLVMQDSLIPAWLIARTWNWYNMFSFRFSTWTQGEEESHLKVVFKSAWSCFVPGYKHYIARERFNTSKENGEQFRYSESTKWFHAYL